MCFSLYDKNNKANDAITILAEKKKKIVFSIKYLTCFIGD